MEEFNDDQYWVPTPPRKMVPSFINVGNGSSYDAVVISSMGEGPKGDKGDQGDIAYFDDLTDEQLAKIYQGASFVGNQSFDEVVTTTGASTTEIEIPFQDYDQFDMLFIDVNGLDLAEGDDYSILGNRIILAEPLPEGQEVHFRLLRYTLVDGNKNIVNDVIEKIHYDIEGPFWGTYENTSYVYIKAPKNTPIKAHYSTTQNVLDYAVSNKTGFSCNAGVGAGLVISNGEVIHRQSSTAGYLEYLCFDNDTGEVFSRPNQTPTEDLVNAGADEAVVAYYKMIENGVPIDLSATTIPAANFPVNPRMGFFVDENGDKYFIATNGRLNGDVGLTASSFASLMLSLGAYNAWNLDGGGSTTFVHKGTLLNRGYDNAGLIPRNIHVGLSIPKKKDNASVEFIYNEISEAANNVIKKVVANDQRVGTVLNTPDLDSITFAGQYETKRAINPPSGTGNGFLYVFSTPNAHGSNWMAQIYIALADDTIWYRYWGSNDIWSNWKVLSGWNLFTVKDPFFLSNIDVNNLLTPGRYQIYSNAYAETVTNIPETHGGTFYVFEHNQTNQIVQAYIPANLCTVYMRRITRSSGEATNWQGFKAITTLSFDTVTCDAAGYIDLNPYINRIHSVISASAENVILIPYRRQGRFHSLKVLNIETMEPLEQGTTISNMIVQYTRHYENEDTTPEVVPNEDEFLEDE